MTSAAEKVALYVGRDKDSSRASTLVREAGIEPIVVTCTPGVCDFKTPLLIAASGVFEGLGEIVWFASLARKGG